MPKEKPSLHSVFLDAGGTLVYSENIFDHLSVRLKDEGVRINADTLQKRFFDIKTRPAKKFYSIKELLTFFMSELSKEFSFSITNSEVLDLYRDIYSTTVKPFGGVFETLQFLRNKKIRLILLSDADSDVLLRGFERLGLGDYFDEKIISSDVEAYKPSDKMAEIAKAYCSPPLEGIVMVGDSQDDVLVAKKMGVQSIFIGLTSRIETRPDDSIAQFSDLIPCLQHNFILPD